MAISTYIGFEEQIKEMSFFEAKKVIHDIEFNFFFSDNAKLFDLKDYIVHEEQKKTIANYNFYCVEDDGYFDVFYKLIENANKKKVLTFQSGNEKEYHYQIVNPMHFEKEYIFYGENKNKDYILMKNKNEIILLFRENNDNKLIPLRIIREIVLRTLENNNEIFFHASALSYKQSGILITGNSGTGKTTLMTHLVYGLKANFIANDRVILNNEMILKQFPLPIRLGIGTVSQFDDIKKIKNFKRKQRGVFSGYYQDNIININRKEKLELTPREFSDAFNVEVQNHSVIKYIIIPKIVNNSNEINIISLTNEEKNKYLQMGCFTPYDESRKETWILDHEFSNEYLENNSRELIRKFINEVKIFKFEFGTNNSSREVTEKLMAFICQ